MTVEKGRLVKYVDQVNELRHKAKELQDAINELDKYHHQGAREAIYKEKERIEDALFSLEQREVTLAEEIPVRSHSQKQNSRRMAGIR